MVVAAVAFAGLGLVAAVGGQGRALFDRGIDLTFIVAADVALVAVGGDLVTFGYGKVS